MAWKAMKRCFKIILMQAHKPEAQFILLSNYRTPAVEITNAASFVLDTFVNVPMQYRGNTGLNEEAKQLFFLAQLQRPTFDGTPQVFHSPSSRCWHPGKVMVDQHNFFQPLERVRVQEILQEHPLQTAD